MIRYDLPQASDVSLIVYDILGCEVAKLVDGYKEPGYHQAQWDAKDQSGRIVPSGIYIALLVTPEYTKSIKTVLLKQAGFSLIKVLNYISGLYLPTNERRWSIV